MKIFRITKIFILLILLLSTRALAKDINFEASVDKKKIGLGQSVQLGLTFDGSQNMPVPQLSTIEGFRVRYLGPSTRMSIVNGQSTSSVTYVFTLLPTKTGNFKIGPFEFEHKGDTYHANAIDIEVLEAAVQPNNQAGESFSPGKDLNDRMRLTIELPRNKIYLNEIIPVTIKLRINELGLRNIQFPQFNHEGFSVGEFERPRQYQDVIDGLNYEIVEFETSLFGLKPGEFRLGPATVQCDLVVRKPTNRQALSSFDDFFNADVFDNIFSAHQIYPMTLKSAELPVTVLALPEENKPADFSGALGIFDFQVQVSPQEVKVGDPITLKATVRGQGNFNTVNLPTINLGNDFKVYEPQIKQEKEVKSFDEVIIPLNVSIKEIPAISFNFFNTQTGQYETITRGPFLLKINKPDKEEVLKITENKQSPARPLVKEEKLGADIIYIKDHPGELSRKQEYLYQNKIFWGFQVIPLLIYLFLAFLHARNRKLTTDVKYARQLLAPRKAKAGIIRAQGLLDKGNTGEFYDALFDVLQEYLGNKFHLSSKGITISIIDEQLKHKKIPENILANLKEIFSECDMVRYAASRLTKENMQKALEKLEEVIDYLQRNKV